MSSEVTPYLRTLSRVCHVRVAGLPFVADRGKSEKGKHGNSVLVWLISPVTIGQPQMDTSPPSIPSDSGYWSQKHRLYAVRALSCEVAGWISFRISRSPSEGIKEVRAASVSVTKECPARWEIRLDSFVHRIRENREDTYLREKGVYRITRYRAVFQKRGKQLSYTCEKREQYPEYLARFHINASLNYQFNSSWVLIFKHRLRPVVYQNREKLFIIYFCMHWI